MGKSKTNTITTADSLRDSAAFFAQCIEKEIATMAEYTVNETVYIEARDPHELFPIYKETQQPVEYPILCFSNYWSPEQLAIGEEHFYELRSEASQCGNETANVSLNNFLRHFLQIHFLYKKGVLTEGTYRTVVQDLLSHIPEK